MHRREISRSCWYSISAGRGLADDDGAGGGGGRLGPATCALAAGIQAAANSRRPCSVSLPPDTEKWIQIDIFQCKRRAWGAVLKSTIKAVRSQLQ